MSARITRSARPAPKPHKPVFPIRKPKLVSAAQAPTPNVEPINVGKVKAHYVGKLGFHAVVWGQYVAFCALVLTCIWVGLSVHRTLTLAQVGEMTCSAENSYMWVIDDPGSKVPKMHDALMLKCARAYNPLG
jgi:hypothetical protein